jgi:ABC-2 type transport system permease protein
MFILVMPIVLMSILGMALQGVFSSDNSGVINTDIAIVKEYQLEEELEKVKDYLAQPMFAEAEFNLTDINIEGIFFDDFLGSTELSEIINYKVVTMEEANDLMANDKISSIIILPKNFIYYSYINYMTPMRTKIKLQIIKNPESAFTAGIVEEIMKGYGNMINNQYAQVNTTLKLLINNNVTEMAIQELFNYEEDSFTEEMDLQTQTVEGEAIVNSFQYYAVAIMAMFILYAASFGAISLYEEKKQFSLQRLEVSGNKVYTLLGSNYFRVFGIVILQSLAIILYSSVVLRVDWGSLSSIIVALLFSAFAVAGIGTFVASLTLVYDNINIANIFQFVFIQMMALLGGSFIPVEILPEGIQKLSVISVNKSIVSLYLNGMMHGNLAACKNDIIYMICFGIIFMLLSVVVFKVTKKEVIG